MYEDFVTVDGINSNQLEPHLRHEKQPEAPTSWPRVLDFTELTFIQNKQEVEHPWISFIFHDIWFWTFFNSNHVSLNISIS